MGILLSPFLEGNFGDLGTLLYKQHIVRAVMCTNADALMPMMSHALFTLSSSFACPTLSHYGYKWLVAIKLYFGGNMEKKILKRF